MNRNNNADTKNIKWVTIGIFLFTAVILAVCIFSRTFAEAYSRTVSDYIRTFLSYVFGIFPFSFAEFLLVFALPLTVVLVIVFLIKRKLGFGNFIRWFLFSLSVLVFLFVNAFAVCYLRFPIEQNLGIGDFDITEEDVISSALYIRDRLTESCESVEFEKMGPSQNPHTFEDMDALISKGYERLSEQYSFLGKQKGVAKTVALSKLMTYTHISGVYFPFTSEANVNTNYPDYVVAFSTAHEKAHQRGVASEDAANFAAFLSCIASEDDYLVYCALLSMYDYYLEEIYRIDSNMYFDMLMNTDKRVLYELKAYSEFFDKYRDSSASKVADTVNDTYLKTMGVDDGVKSYGRVVKLCTSYLLQKEALQ